MITLTAEQAQQIEEAFEGIVRVFKFETGTPVEALATIRAARAQEQAEQEPVAWVWLDEWLNDGYPEDCFSRVNHQNKTPLYAAPVRTKYLTDAEIADIGTNCGTSMWSLMFARVVIAKLREKECK